MNRHKLLTKGKFPRVSGWSRWLDRNECYMNTKDFYYFCPECRMKVNKVCPVCRKIGLAIASYWKLPRKNASNKIWREFMQLLKVKRGIITF